MIGKHYELKRLRQWNHAFEAHLHDQRNILELPETFKNKRSIPYADLFTDAIESYWRAAAIGKEKGETDMRARLEHTENALQRALSRQTLRYEIKHDLPRHHRDGRAVPRHAPGRCGA